MSGGEFYRYGDDSVPLALGSEPLADHSYLLPPIPLPPPSPALPEGPHPVSEFIVELIGPFPVSTAAAREAFPTPLRAALGFPVVWALPMERHSAWTKLEDTADSTRLTALTLSWELTTLLTEGGEAAEELGRYLLGIGPAAALLGLTPTPTEAPGEAGQRAAALRTLRHRYSLPVEMRLLPQGRAFPAREVWRTAYSLGFIWGEMNLFHFRDAAGERSLFRLHAVGHPGYFLPERAAEGEAVQGIALAFELPHAPAPLETYDRMGIALAHFRKCLGGRPLTPDGSELDGDRLWDDRDRLADAVQEMSRLGLLRVRLKQGGFFSVRQRDTRRRRVRPGREGEAAGGG